MVVGLGEGMVPVAQLDRQKVLVVATNKDVDTQLACTRLVEIWVC